MQSRLGMTAEQRRATLAEETEDVAREDQIVLQEMAEQAAAMHMEESMMNHSEQDMNTTDESSQYAGLLASFRETERIYGGFEAWQRLDLADRTELDYEGWIVARTPEFKEYFGDWEAVRGELPETLDGDLGRRVNNAMDIAEGAINYYTGEPMGVIIDDYIELVQHAEEMGVSLKQLRAEYDAVAARYKDTPQWMKAPNGEPSKLTERQWVLVRTPRFKAFFGNWELKHKEFAIVETQDATFNSIEGALKWVGNNGILGTMTNEETGGKGEMFISASAVREMLNPRQREKSASNSVHYAALTKIRDIIRESELIDAHPDHKKGADGQRSPQVGINLGIKIEVLYGAMRHDEHVYRVKTTVKHYADKNRVSKANAYHVEKVEVEGLAGTLGSDANASTPGTSPSETQARRSARVSGAILLHGVRKINLDDGRPDALALEDCSAALDANGEPIVLNTGSPKSGFTVFDNTRSLNHRKSQTPDGTTWFSDALATAASYSGTTRAAVMLGDYYDGENNIDPGNYACFLSIRNPFEAWFEGANWDGIHYGKVRIIEVANWMLLVEGREPVRACSPRP